MKKKFYNINKVANVVKLFGAYVTICVTSVKIFLKYSDSDVNYADKCFMTLTPWATNDHCYKTIFGIIYATIGVTSVKI
jgi:hypothetical protein